jgi:hypothetical protein
MEFQFLHRVTWLVVVLSLAVALTAALLRT